MSDPQRLLSGNDALATALLESASSPDPTNAERDVLWRSLANRLPEAVLVGTAGAALSKAGGAKLAASAVLMKTAIALGIAGSVAAVVVVAGTWSARSVVPVVSAPAVSAPAPVVTAPPLPSIASAPPIIAAPPTVSVEALPRAVAAPVAPRTSTSRASSSIASAAPPPPEVAESTLGAESAVLLHARRTLRSGDCASARNELEEARARFAGGALTQEREVLTIEALSCSGQTDAAAARAAAFLRAYPTSPHAPAVRKLSL